MGGMKALGRAFWPTVIANLGNEMYKASQFFRSNVRQSGHELLEVLLVELWQLDH